MTQDQAQSPDGDMLACYYCGEPTPAAKGSVCWVCLDKQKTAAAQSQTQARSQNEQLKQMKRIRWLLAIIVAFIGLILLFGVTIVQK